MASNNHASYTLIGATVLFGALAIAATLVYIGGAGSEQDELLAETFSSVPVNGLAVGSVVNYRGVKVGEVKRISFIGAEYDCRNEMDYGKVYILLKFYRRQFRRVGWESAGELLEGTIKRGLHATVSSSGITGMSRIELNLPTHPIAEESYSWTPRHPLIPPSPSMLESFSVSATKVMNQINKMNFTEVWSNISSVAASSAKLAESAERLIESQKSGIASVVKDLGETAANVHELTEKLRDNPSLLLRPNDPERLEETER